MISLIHLFQYVLNISIRLQHGAKLISYLFFYTTIVRVISNTDSFFAGFFFTVMLSSQEADSRFLLVVGLTPGQGLHWLTPCINTPFGGIVIGEVWIYKDALAY